MSTICHFSRALIGLFICGLCGIDFFPGRVGNFSRLLLQVMLAGRDIGLFVGVLTIGATWVVGGFINGSAQETYNAGLIWTQAPFGYAMSLFISKLSG